MVQSLEAVLTKLQKIYQMKSIELENLQKESEIKKIAFVIAHLKDAEEISTYDSEKVGAFLSHITDEINLDNVNLACSVVSMTENPAIRMGKRFQDALELLKRIRLIAEEYLELQRDLPTKLASCERSLAEMEDLFNVLANKVIVEDIDKYLRILEHELFPDDVHTVLTVVAAIVIRNATILEHPALIERPSFKAGPEIEPVVYEETATFEGDAILAELAEEASFENPPIEETPVEEEIIPTEEAPMEEETPEFIEVVEEVSEVEEEVLPTEEILEIIEEPENAEPEEQTEELIDEPLFEEPVEMGEIVEDVEEETPEILEVVEELEAVPVEVQIKEIVYNISTPDDENSFHCDRATVETVELIEQLRKGVDDQNINRLDNDMGVITGLTEFLLFKDLPNNHEFILLNGLLNDLDAKTNSEQLEKFNSSNIVRAISRIVENNDDEYQKLATLTRKVEEIFVEKGIRSAV